MDIDSEVTNAIADRLDVAASDHSGVSIIEHEAFFLFRIGNYSHLLAAFGEEALDSAVAAALRFLREVVGGEGSAALCRHDVIGVRLISGAILGECLEASRCDAWMRHICETLPLMPFESGDMSVHLWISGFWTLHKDQENHTDHLWHFPYVCPDQGHAGWRAQYRNDMAKASRVLAALRTSGETDAPEGTSITPFWQRVHSASSGSTQFYEALARLPDPDGRPGSIADGVLAMERTGFIRLLDLNMVRQVAAELVRAPAIQAAVNISAISVRDDGWWEEIKSGPLSDPQMASRLFLEITETTSFPDISEAVRFLDGMRKLGCRIVLDDFGAGHASIRQLFALCPDVVKIDRLFLRRAALSDRDQEVFSSLVRLARSSGATVVAEGVETAGQKRIALEAGVDWLQGYLWGQPIGGRPRSCSSAVTNLPAANAA